jgi:uncharacterized BrkB/YihY/UPF0761 family membrane protein
MQPIFTILFSLATYLLILFVFYRLITEEKKLNRITVTAVFGVVVTAIGTIIAMSISI